MTVPVSSTATWAFSRRRVLRRRMGVLLNCRFQWRRKVGREKPWSAARARARVRISSASTRRVAAPSTGRAQARPKNGGGKARIAAVDRTRAESPPLDLRRKVAAWRVTNAAPATRFVFERNPYYHRVDSLGRQLPYIDRVVMTVAENLEVLNLRAMAGDIQVGGVLPGERGPGAVLTDRRGAHRDGHVAAAVLGAELVVRGTDVAVEFRLQRRVDDPSADFLARRGECADVLDVERC